jgi:hypothetical protein
MTTRNITVTYPDAAGPTVLAALKWHYGKVEDPPGSRQFRDRTNAEAIAMLEAGVRAGLRDIVHRYQLQTARDTAEAGVTPIEVTA